jgi:hypothetical protein
MSISSSTAATAAPAPTTPSLNDTIAILSEIWIANAAIPGNEHILERIHAYVKTQLPQSIKNYQTAHAERETRKKSLELFADEFTESFLNRNKYFYSPHSELYFTYHNQVRYALIHEDQIHHRILADITASDFLSATATTSATKYRIKNRVIKSIQSSRDILSAIPESRTIQNVIGLLYPALFHTRDHAKYFLTILGDVLLKKAAPLIYFVPVVAKELIKDLGSECYALFGSTAHSFSTAFKFKYYEHQYKDCRLVDIRCGGGGSTQSASSSSSATFMLRLSNMPELLTSIIDLFCVAAHYSHRFGSADDFLRLHCKTPEVSSHAWFLRDRTDQQIIDEFMNYATEPASSDHEITMTNMMYLWKMYLSEFRLPSVFFAATLRSKLASIASPSPSATTPDTIPNRTSKYLPIVSQFRQFWSENCFTDDREIELEIDELSTLFNEYTASAASPPVGDATLLGMLRHFYPDVIIEDDKYILNVGCKLWDKTAEINEYLLQFKELCITNHHSFPQPLYNAYEFYCGKCYATAKRRIISKRYFEKYFMEEYPDYIDENGMITIKWWGVTDDDYDADDADDVDDAATLS